VRQEFDTVSGTKGGPVYGLAMRVASSSTVFPKPISSAKPKIGFLRQSYLDKRDLCKRDLILNGYLAQKKVQSILYTGTIGYLGLVKY
jgi:hypothetical protein